MVYVERKSEGSGGSDLIVIAGSDHSLHWIPADQLAGYLRGIEYVAALAACLSIGLLFLALL